MCWGGGGFVDPYARGGQGVLTLSARGSCGGGVARIRPVR